MKTKLTLMCLTLSVMMMAQVNDNPVTIKTDIGWYLDGHPFDIISKSLSYDGSNRVIMIGENQAEVYSNAFEFVRRFVYEPTICNSESRIKVVEKTTAIGTQVVQIQSGESQQEISYEDSNGWNYSNYFPESWTLQQKVDYVSNSGYGEVLSYSTNEAGDVIILFKDENNYYHYLTNGRQYPASWAVIRDNQLFSAYAIYEEQYIYSDTWEEVSREPQYEKANIGMGMFDYDNGEYQYVSGINMGIVTQTLFNEDELYEYIHFTEGEWYRAYYGNEPTPSHNDQETITRTSYYHPLCGGFEILSETGNSLCSISFPSTFKVSLWYGTVNMIKLDGLYYLCVTGKISDEEYGELIYKIDRSDKQASVQQVSMPIRIGAFPNPAKTDQTITIQLTGENAGKAQTELQITDMQGKTIDRRMIPAGQQQTTVSAKHFAPGMNIINILQNGKSVGTEKVIVK